MYVLYVTLASALINYCPNHVTKTTKIGPSIITSVTIDAKGIGVSLRYPPHTHTHTHTHTLSPTLTHFTKIEIRNE